MTHSLPEYDYLAAAKAAHEKAGFDFEKCFDWWFTHGWVFKGPEYLLIGGHDEERPDAWFVWWAEVHPNFPRTLHNFKPIHLFLSLMPYPKPFVSWARCASGSKHTRYYRVDELARAAQKDFCRQPPRNRCISTPESN